MFARPIAASLIIISCLKSACIPVRGDEEPAPAQTEAAAAAERAVQIARRDELWTQAMKRQGEGKLDEAIKAGEQVLTLEKQLLGDRASELPTILEWLSNQNLLLANMEAAKKYAVELQHAQENQHGRDAWQTVTAVWWLDYVQKMDKVEFETLSKIVSLEAESNRLISSQNYHKAATQIAELLQLKQQVLGTEHPYLASTLASHANCLLQAWQYPEAEASATRSMQILRQQFGDKHPDTAEAAWIVASARIRRGNHSEALTLLELARDTWQATGHTVDAAWVESRRGQSLAALDRIPEAHTAYQTAIEALRKLCDPAGERRDYANNLNNLALLYSSIGDYANAETLYIQVLEIRKEIPGREHAEYATSLNNLADFYTSISEYEKAESFYNEWIAIQKKLLGSQNQQYAQCLKRLADWYRYSRSGNFAKAIPLLVEWLAIQKKLLGDQASDYAECLNELADCYKAADDPANAEVLYLEWLAIQKKIHGDQNREYARCLDQLGSRYAEMGDNVKAVSLFEQALKMQENSLDEQYPDCVETLNHLVALYESMGNYRQAELFYNRSRDIRHNFFELQVPDYAARINTFADLFYELGEYADAKPFFAYVLESQKRAVGEEHPDVARSLNRLALLNMKTGDFKEAEKLYTQALNIWKSTRGEQDLNYAGFLDDLATLYDSQGIYFRAEPLLIQSRDIRKNILGENHPAYATSMANLAWLYHTMGNDAQAVPLYVQVIDIRKRVLGEFDLSYITSLNNLALIYRSMGDSDRAEPLLIQLLGIRRSSVGEEHPDYADSLSNLGDLYCEVANYAKAEPLLTQALDIRRKVLGEEHPDYALSVNNLAFYYQAVGDFSRAELFFKNSLDVNKKLFGEEHPAYATSLSNLTLLYLGTKQRTILQTLERSHEGVHQLALEYAKAEPLLIQACDIQRRIYGEENAGYATMLNNLGQYYMSVGDVIKALPLFMRARDIRKHILSEDHPDYANSLENLADFYLSIGEYTAAEPLLTQACDIYGKAFGAEHPKYADSLAELAYFCVSTGDYPKAEGLMLRALTISRRTLESASLTLSERQQLAMNHMLRHRLDSYLSLSLNTGRFHLNAIREALLWKGATLVRQRAMRLAADDPAIADQFRELQRVARQLASLSRATPVGDPDEWRARMSDLTDQKEALESRISRASAEFRAAQNQITLEQIQEAIPESGVLVDYLQFSRTRPREQKGEWDFETSLVAFVVPRNGEPALIELGPVAPVSEAIDTWRLTFGMSPEGQAAGRLLRQTIWEPVWEEISRVLSTSEMSGRNAQPAILISTDGVMGQLPLGALPGKEPGGFLIEDHRIAMIPAARLLPDLIRPRDEHHTKHQKLLVGGIDYGVDPDGRNLPWVSLPGAEREIKSVAALYLQTEDAEEATVVTLIGNDASEQEVLRHIHLASIQHFATHGLFESREERIAPIFLEVTNDRGASIASDLTAKPDVDRQTITAIRSGLVLAGANSRNTAIAESELEKQNDDGILMDTEILTLPLQNAELIVLSACDTGQGKAEGGEGLLGIQRAFHVAGARTTVASLWKVDDVATQVLMERFHHNLCQPNMPRLDALRDAQLWMLNNPDAIRGASIKPEATDQRVSPRFWAAFQLCGDWR